MVVVPVRGSTIGAVYTGIFYHVETFFQTYKPEKKSIRVVFRDELDGDVRFNVAPHKPTKNYEKQKY